MRIITVATKWPLRDTKLSFAEIALQLFPKNDLPLHEN
jgi:hypothetical protein